jgi:hypothetical protein
MFNLPESQERRAKEAKKKEQGSRGKASEKAIKAMLEKFNRRYARFDYERVYDARSARGRATARTGDYNVWCNSIPYTIEVKEVDHKFRLPAKNFDAAAVARMEKRLLSGTTCLVLVFHKPLGLWRMPSLDVFSEAKPSWDLTAWPTFTEDALFKALDRLFSNVRYGE